MPNSEMKPMMAGMLMMPLVKRIASTPPIRAKGKFRSTTPAWLMLLNWAKSSRKMTKMAPMEAAVSTVRRLAHFRTGRHTLPGSLREVYLLFDHFLNLIDHPTRSPPVMLADITILRATFSRLIVLGPVVDTTSAIFPKGTFCPLASTINSLIRSAVADYRR